MALDLFWHVPGRQGSASCLLLLFAATAQPAELARWSSSAQARSSGVELLRSGNEWKLETAGGVSFAALPPSTDYYRRAMFTARLEKPSPSGAWLSIGYLDRGYGLITLSALNGQGAGSGIRQQDQWGIVRLNTGKIRRAVFRLPEFSKELRIAGIPQMTELVVSDVKPEYEVAPLVDPAFRLNRPLDLVMSSGADADKPEALPEALASIRNLAPLVRALGFNGVESYVKWRFVEPSPGKFDWSFYDSVVAECQKYGLKWFPLLIVGSAYALPDWFYNSPEHFRYKCLEHGLENDIPTIFHEGQVKYVRRFLTEFGKHYASNPALLGVRLGPTANYGEAQYPATGAWGYQGKDIHTHLGFWVGDVYAAETFRKSLQSRYTSIADLNRAWGGTVFSAFDEVKPFLPITALSPRMRKDFTTWYMDAMTEWCERWAKWAREAMPRVSIYQSSGGWGAVEIGTDYIAHTKSMAALGGGIRMTNENDSYVNNFCVTRPAASAARFYGTRFGTEPAGFGTRRGVMNRLFNIIGNDGQHLFYYSGNLYDNDQAIDGWLQHAPLLDQRSQPAVDVAVLYPDTANRLDDSVMRHLSGSTLFNAAYQMRSLMDYDFMGEQMILDGALERYKVLVFLVGRVVEKPVLDRIDAWVRSGGVVIFPVREGSRTPPLTTVEGDSTVYKGWQRGETGKGRVLLYDSHPDVKQYMSYLRKQLLSMPAIRPAIRRALASDKPDDTYWAVLADDRLVLLNYADNPATVRMPEGKMIQVRPYSIVIE